MIVIEYILDPQDKPRSFNPKTIPSYVKEGGVFLHPDGSERMIGVGVEGSIPDNIKTFTLEELQARELAIHAQYPMKKYDGVNIETETLTHDEIKAGVKVWWDAR
jgi:hypothetical protein